MITLYTAASNLNCPAIKVTLRGFTLFYVDAYRESEHGPYVGLFVRVLECVKMRVRWSGVDLEAYIGSHGLVLRASWWPPLRWRLRVW